MCRSPLLPLLARELGATPRVVGLVMAASTITGVFVKLPAGTWSDVVGRRPLLLAATLVFALLPFSYLLAGSLVTLIAVRFVHGSATAIMGPVMSAAISDLAPTHRRATWLSLYSTVQGTGQAIGPVLAGWLITRGRYDLAFLCAGLVAVPALLLTGAPRGNTTPPGRPAPGSFMTGIAEVARERRILVASVAHAFYFVINGTLNAFLPLFAADRIGLNAVQIGWMFGLQTLTTLAIRPLIGAASDRVGHRGSIAVGLIACAVSVVGISLSQTPAWIYAAVLVYAASVALTTAATSAYITDAAPKARCGAAHGVFGTIYDIGDAGGPLLGGVLVQAWGYAPAFQFMAALAVVTAIAFASLSSDARPAAGRRAARDGARPGGTHVEG